MRDKTILFALAAIALQLTNFSFAQVTVTQSQIEAIFSVGKTVKFYTDTTSKTVNVGRTGGPNVYDFRNLPFYFVIQSTVVSVSQISQLAPRYPSNAITFNFSGRSGKFQYLVLSFANQQWLSHGEAKIFSSTSEYYKHKSPSEFRLSFPVTFNTQFSQTFTIAETTYTNGVPTQTSSTSISRTMYVDGYGTLLLPGGLSFNCLRVRDVDALPSNGKEFLFVTQEGALLSISSFNTQPDTGFVQTNDAPFYFLGGSLTSVRETGNLPVQFSLSQNYPNPFNPSTTIRFALPKSAYVTLKIFNLLGQEIGTLVSGKFSAGDYYVQWNALGLPSGVYLYRIQADEFVETKKVILLK